MQNIFKFLESQFHYLFCLKFLFKVVDIIVRVMQENKTECFFKLNVGKLRDPVGPE